MSFFDTLRALYPKGKAFFMTQPTLLRMFNECLASVPEAVRNELSAVYLDMFPETTRHPEEWEKAFGVPVTLREREKERDILAALWEILGGNESAGFMEQVLKHIDPEFHVEENVPCSDPRNRESSGVAVCDYDLMVCDYEEALCDLLRGDENFTPLVLQNDVTELYAIPDNPEFWEACFFVCRNLYRNEAMDILYIEPLDVDIRWKRIVEYLILKIKPAHSTAVLYVRWVGGENDTH